MVLLLPLLVYPGRVAEAYLLAITDILQKIKS